jgi:3-hydroxybutyrate dehydrogenase
MNVQLNSRAAADRRPLDGRSTSGFGLGIARALAAAGSDGVLNGPGPAAKIAAARERIAAERGVNVNDSAADMSNPDATCEMMAATLAHSEGSRT